MEERIYEVEMIYIKNTSGNDYSIEFMGRRINDVKLNFSNVESIEIDAKKGLEIKNSYIQMSEGQPKVQNYRFTYPVNLRVKYMGKILIEVN
jgi:hypothetical protein